jgi:transposase
MLMSAEGLSNNRIAQRLSISRPTLILWRKRFAADGPAALTETAPGCGQPPSITQEKIEEIIEATLHTKPKGAIHWS